MMDADAVVNAQRQVDLSRLPLYHANHKKDVFTAEEWVERVQRAKDAGTWNDAATTSYVYNALREGALTWYRTLKWSNVNNQVWAEVKTAFLEAYGTTHTSRTTATAINDLKQGTDSVIDYYTKVVEVMSDLQALMPPDGLGRPDVLFSPEIRALAGYVGLAADNKTGAADTLITFGAQRMIYFVATQIFINGLKPEIRTEVMKANPVTIMRACTEAQTIEKISATKKQTTTSNGNGTHIAGIDENQDNSPEELQLQIDELQRRKQWATRRTGNSGQSGSPGYPGQSGSYGNRTGGGNNRKPNPAKGKMCHYCKKVNHFQKDCRARLAAGAPMVPPPNRVSETRPTGEDPDIRYCHPFQQEQYGMDGLYAHLN